MESKLSDVYIAAAQSIDSGDMRYSCIAVKEAYNEIFDEHYRSYEACPAVRHYISTLGFDKQTDLQSAIETPDSVTLDDWANLRVWLLCMVAGVTMAIEEDGESTREGQ